jgi:hypothetical protein
MLHELFEGRTLPEVAALEGHLSCVLEHRVRRLMSELSEGGREDGEPLPALEPDLVPVRIEDLARGVQRLLEVIRICRCHVTVYR